MFYVFHNCKVIVEKILLPDDLSFFENLDNALIVNVSSNVWAIVGIVFFMLTSILPP